MEATNILMSEHRVIEKVLDALDHGADRLEAGEGVTPEFFLNTADFIRGFADGCHHVKEEEVLFPDLVQHGVPQQGGPVGVMLSEHEQGRVYTRGMRAAAERLQAGDPSAKAEILRNARGYTALLHAHILKEENVLFTLADRVIPADEQPQVVEDFEAVEHEETGEGVHEKYLAMADSLEKMAEGGEALTGR